jgi:hypothetical protein
MTKSSKILLRIPEALHTRIKARAAKLGVSVNTFIERTLERGLLGDSTAEIETTIINTAVKTYGDDFLGLLLFGSRARGDAHDLSDTDLLLVVRDSLRIERELYRPWDSTLPDTVSLHLAHLPPDPRAPGSLWLECALDAKIVFDPTGVIGSTLRSLKELITSGTIVRRETHGQGFWMPR